MKTRTLHEALDPMKQAFVVVVLALAPATMLSGCSDPGPKVTDSTTEDSARPAADPASSNRPALDAATRELLRETAELHRQGRFEEGLERLRQEIERDPNRPRLHYNLGVFRASLEDYEGATAAFEEELERFPDHGESHRALATAYTRLGRLDEAVLQYEACLGDLPDDALCTSGLGRNLSALGRTDEALPFLQQAADEAQDAAAYAELALLHRRRGDLQESARAFSRALADDPRHLPTLLGYGQVLNALGHRQDGAALLDLHQHLSTLQDQLDAFERARRQGTPPVQAYLDLAHIHLQRDDRTAAIDAYRQALDLAPDNAAVALELADLYLQGGQAVAAEAAVRQALATDPQGSGPHFYLGVTQVLTGERELAQSSFVRSLEAGDWPAPAFLDLGAAFQEVGDLERAAAAYLEALRLEPENPRVHFGLSGVLRQHGDRENALKAAQKAVELEPSYGEAWALLGVLRSETGDPAGAEAALQRSLEPRRPTLLRAEGEHLLLAALPSETADPARELFRRLLTEYREERPFLAPERRAP